MGDLSKMTTSELLALKEKLQAQNRRTGDRQIINSNLKWLVRINAVLMKRGE